MIAPARGRRSMPPTCCGHHRGVSHIGSWQRSGFPIPTDVEEKGTSADPADTAVADKVRVGCRAREQLEFFRAAVGIAELASAINRATSSMPPAAIPLSAVAAAIAGSTAIAPLQQCVARDVGGRARWS
jgi:hypothetical protein